MKKRGKNPVGAGERYDNIGQPDIWNGNGNRSVDRRRETGWRIHIKKLRSSPDLKRISQRYEEGALHGMGRT